MMMDNNSKKEKEKSCKPYLVLAIILGLVIIFSLDLLSKRNVAVRLEEKIESQLTSNKSEYDKMWKKFVEMTQVTELQAGQFKDVYTGMIQGRYQDSKLLFKMVKENNPQLDTKVYSRLQTEISANRDCFHNSQKKISDVIREYNTFVREHFVMAYITHRQIKKSEQYIITSGKTSNAFETKKDDVIDLRQQKK